MCVCFRAWIGGWEDTHSIAASLCILCLGAHRITSDCSTGFKCCTIELQHCPPHFKWADSCYTMEHSGISTPVLNTSLHTVQCNNIRQETI